MCTIQRAESRRGQCTGKANRCRLDRIRRFRVTAAAALVARMPYTLHGAALRCTQFARCTEFPRACRRLGCSLPHCPRLLAFLVNQPFVHAEASFVEQAR